MGRRTEPRMSGGPTSRHFSLNAVPLRHLLSHEHQDFSVAFFRATKKAAKLVKPTCILSRATPQNIVGVLPFREIRQLGRLFSVVEELIHRDFEGTGELFKRLYSWNSVAVFDAGHVATKESRLLFNVTL